MNEILGQDRMSELLGRLRRKAKKNPKLAAKIALARKRVKRKSVLPGVWSKLSQAARSKALAEFLKKNPKVKRKVALTILAKRLQLRKGGKVTPPGAVQESPVPATPPAPPPAPEPASAPVPQEDTESTAQATTEEMMSEPMEEAAEAETETEEKGEDMAKEVSDEGDVTEMTEPSAEEAAEQREEMVADAEQAASAASGDFVMGVRLGRLRKRMRDRRYERECVRRAAPLAGKLHDVTGGAIDKKKTLKAVKVLAKAKRGDKKAKKGVKVVAKLAKKSPAAEKTLAQLTVASKIMKKTAKVPYSRPVRVVTKGLTSYSPYQRGLAMIPGTARARYGSQG